MSERSNRNKKLTAALIILIIAILGAIAYAIGNSLGDNSHSTNKVATTQQPSKPEQGNTNSQPQVQGASTTTPSSDQAPVDNTPTPAPQPVVHTASTTPTPTTPTTNNPNTTPTPPVTTPTDNTPAPTPTPTDPCAAADLTELTFDSQDEIFPTIYVNPGERTNSYVIFTPDNSSALWYSMNEGVVTNDSQLPDKSGFKAYIVIESATDANLGGVVGKCIIFHVRATADAPAGPVDGSGPYGDSFGFVTSDPTNPGMPTGFYPFDIVVNDTTPVVPTLPTIPTIPTLPLE